MMKTPTKKIIRVEFFDCGNPDHRHKTEDAASSCIKKQTGKTHNKKWTKEAFAIILNLHRGGARKSDLARMYGLSRTRISAILFSAEKIERAPEPTDPMNELDGCVRYPLLGANLRTIQAVRDAVENGKIYEVANIGPIKLKKIRLWLDLHSDTEK